MNYFSIKCQIILVGSNFEAFALLCFCSMQFQDLNDTFACCVCVSNISLSLLIYLFNFFFNVLFLALKQSYCSYIHAICSLNLCAQLCHIGVYFTAAKQNWLLQHGINSFTVLNWFRKFPFCILQTISCRTVSERGMNSLLSFGKSFLQLSKMLLRMVMIVERMWFLDW